MTIIIIFLYTGIIGSLISIYINTKLRNNEIFKMIRNELDDNQNDIKKESYKMRISKFITSNICDLVINFVWYFGIINVFAQKHFTYYSETLRNILVFLLIVEFINSFINYNNKYLIFDSLPDSHLRLKNCNLGIRSILLLLTTFILIWHP